MTEWNVHDSLLFMVLSMQQPCAAANGLVASLGTNIPIFIKRELWRQQGRGINEDYYLSDALSAVFFCSCQCLLLTSRKGFPTLEPP